jgi:hypothetical protein
MEDEFDKIEKYNNILKKHYTLKMKDDDIDYLIVDTIESKDKLINDVKAKYGELYKKIRTLDELKAENEPAKNCS